MSTLDQPETEARPKGRRGIGDHLYDWLDERMGLKDIILPVIVHPVPRKLNFWYVFGSATLAAFVVQVVTGVALAMTYVPSTSNAYQSLQFITHDAVLGRVVRGMHFWGASAMVIFIAIHTISVFLMGSFKYPREVNWLTGSFLLLMTLAMAFSGQLLRWDQTAYWSVGVAAAQAGKTPIIGNWLAQVVVAGQTIGGATLTRFFATHVFLIPAIMFLLVGLHLYLVVKDGVSELPVAGKPVRRATYRREYHRVLKEDGEPFFPDFIWKDVVFALLTVIVLLILAIWIGPPEIDRPPDPTIIQAYPRPDWYFLPYFAVLALLPPAVENWVILGAPLLGGIIMLVVPFIANQGERAPSRRPWSVAIVIVFLAAALALGIAGDRAPWSPKIGEGQPGPIPPQLLVNTSPAAQHGAQVFQDKTCHSCHMLAGTGGERGPDLTHVGTRLTRDQLTWRILGGGNNMPAYGGNIDTNDLNDLLDFLQGLK
ncbi:MAG: cytochrome b N-terminal domain-containing protein [Thermomicrobiales bacterium]